MQNIFLQHCIAKLNGSSRLRKNETNSLPLDKKWWIHQELPPRLCFCPFSVVGIIKTHINTHFHCRLFSSVTVRHKDRQPVNMFSMLLPERRHPRVAWVHQFSRQGRCTSPSCRILLWRYLSSPTRQNKDGHKLKHEGVYRHIKKARLAQTHSNTSLLMYPSLLIS